MLLQPVIYIFGRGKWLLFIGAAFAALPIICVLTTFAQDKSQPSEVEYWKKQKLKSMEARTEPVGLHTDGLEIPAELRDGVGKQLAKINELIKDTDFKMPMDFADLASRRANGDLVDVSLVTDSYLLDLGGSATDAVFTGYEFADGSKKLTPARLKILSVLAKDFGGRKFDLNKPADRKQMRRALLRMLSPQAKILLEEIAAEYKDKFDRPLRITSLVRSMDYQVELNRSIPDTFKVRGAGSMPPHVSGFAFDITFRNMNAEEQNFLMKKIAELERDGKVDGFREEGTSQVFHIFVYPDGKPAKKS